MDNLNEPEYEIESIIRARATPRGRGKYREALVKWAGWAEPTWEPVENVKETAALEKFKSTYS